jgi:hypothetical protein
VATGAGGKSLSPVKTETFSNGTPSFSAAACSITVYRRSGGGRYEGMTVKSG